MGSTFDPDAYLASKGVQAAAPVKSGFDPDAYLRAKGFEQGPTPTTSAGMAGLEGVGQGVAMGYLPQLQAVTEPLMAKGLDLITGNDVASSLPDYVTRRDENIERQRAEAQQHPAAYYGGQVAGTVLSAPAVSAGLSKVGLGAARGAGLLGRVGKAAASGAVMGAAQNPGDTEGVVDPLQAEARVANAKSGALIGGAVQGGAEALSKTVKIVRGIPDFINDFAEARGAAATGLYKHQAKAAIKADPTGEAGKGLRELGRYVLDNKIVRVGDSIEDVANRSGALKKQFGERIGQVYDKAVQTLEDPSIIKQTEFLPDKLSSGFLNTIKQKFAGKPNGDAIIAQARKLTGDLRGGGEFLSSGRSRPAMNINELQDFKAGLDDMIYKADTAFKRAGQQTPGIEAAHELRDFIKKRMDDALGAIDKAFGMSLGEDIKSLNKHYSMVSKVNSIAKDRLAGEMGNNFLSLTDKMAGIGGAGIGAVEGYKHDGLEGALVGGSVGAAAGLASKGMRTYGRPAITVGADKLGGLLSSIPNMGGEQVQKLTGAIQSAPGLLGNLGARLKGPKYSGGLLPPAIAPRDADRIPAKEKKK